MATLHARDKEGKSESSQSNDSDALIWLVCLLIITVSGAAGLILNLPQTLDSIPAAARAKGVAMRGYRMLSQPRFAEANRNRSRSASHRYLQCNNAQHLAESS